MKGCGNDETALKVMNKEIADLILDDIKNVSGVTIDWFSYIPPVENFRRGELHVDISYTNPYNLIHTVLSSREKFGVESDYCDSKSIFDRDSYSKPGKMSIVYYFGGKFRKEEIKFR